MTGTDTGYAMPIMPNNLHKMITSSGLSKREVAALKGVTPETLSRHISGKIGISLDDAEQYAKILGCTAQEVFFAADPIRIIGTNILRPQKMRHQEPHDCEWQRELSSEGKQYYAAFPSIDPKVVGVWHTLIDRPYNGRFEFLQNTIEFVLREPIEKLYVSPQQCAGRLCYVEIDGTHKCSSEATKIIQALVYPNPDGTYTLVNVYGLCTIENKLLNWATPILGTSMMPTQSAEEVLTSSRGRINHFS